MIAVMTSLMRSPMMYSMTSSRHHQTIKIFPILVFNIINWNFPALAFNEFVLSQNKIFFISNIRFSLMRNKFLSHEYRVLSSAKLHISDLSIKKNISFMNILHSSGPNIDP